MPPNMKGSGARPRLRDRLVAYFARNDEILALTDIVLKFNVDWSTAQQCVLHMRGAGLLEETGRAYKTAPLMVRRGPALREMVGHE